MCIHDPVWRLPKQSPISNDPRPIVLAVCSVLPFSTRRHQMTMHFHSLSSCPLPIQYLDIPIFLSAFLRCSATIATTNCNADPFCVTDDGHHWWLPVVTCQQLSHLPTLFLLLTGTIFGAWLLVVCHLLITLESWSVIVVDCCGVVALW